jgi:hypothetical protein
VNEPTQRPELLDQPVSSVLDREGAPKAFLESGLGQCIGCAMAPFETLGEALQAFGLEPGRVLRALERALRGDKR